MSKILLKSIKGLVQARETVPQTVAGSDMANLPVIEDAWMAVEDGEIIGFGPMTEFPGITDWSGLEVIDCSGRYVLPAWCDPHTHLVHAAPREGEFVDRIKGLSYEEIAKELEAPLGTVKAQLHRARELMYDLVKNKKEHI